ncbi:MAG: cytochrome c biogenesis protein CcmE, partial [Bradyrhizobium sp.]
YMPKDVADALKKQGLWKEEYGAGSKDGNTAAARAAQSGQGAMR